MRYNTLLAKVGTVIGLASCAASVSAGGVFTVNPGWFGSGAPAFQADKLGSTGVTQAHLSAGFGSAAGTVTGSGYTRFTSFSLAGSPVFFTGLNGDYQLWAEFSFTMTLTSGGLGALNSNYVINSVNYSLWGESLAGANTSFSAGNVNTSPVVTHSLGAQGAKQLGTGSLLFPGSGAANINAGGGSSFNPLMAFSLTNPDGPGFFTAPNPFFPLAFSSFTNTSIAVFRDFGTKNMYLVTDGGTDFLQPIPEPMSLALVGVGLLGVGAVSRRQLRK